MTTRTEPLIVVGVDGSQHSRQALRWAVEHARSLGGRVHAVVGWEWNRNPFALGAAADRTSANELVTIEDAAGQRLAETVEETLGAEPGVRVCRRVLQGPAAQVLIEAARDAEVLVVGTRGYGGIKGALLGSVSQQVVQYAPCSVVVVRDRAERAAA
ncbi:universal stress protein [Streptomyces sp. BI20]|uniref:universal stress protein n=1 Tax=Streptomyces sp. BI20 TaxID=3403460 RepID=UPI003C71A2BB